MIDGGKFERVGQSKEYINFDATIYINQKGTFSFDIPLGARYTEQLQKGIWIYTKINGFDYWGIIKERKERVEPNNEIVTVNGEDLKSILEMRITLPAETTDIIGTAGYDAIEGDTETCIKYFWEKNIVTPSQGWRRIPNTIILENQNRGNAEDKYMSRHELVSDVTKKMLEAEKMGCNIDVDLMNNKITFDVFKGADRTINQNDEPRIVFSLENKNLMNYEITDNDSNYKSVFYATKSGEEFADEALTAIYYRDEDIPEGWDCVEQHLNISVNTPVAGDEYNEMKRLAEIEMSDYEKINTLEAKATSKLQVNTDYFLGDFVTVKINNTILNTQIIGLHVSENENSTESELIFGNKVPNYTDKITKKIKNGG